MVFRFMDLPAEIRDVVYGDILRRPQPIVFDPPFPGPNYVPGEWSNQLVSLRAIYASGGTGGPGAASRQLQLQDQDPNEESPTTAIFRVSRQVSEEAQVAFYRANTFLFPYTSIAMLMMNGSLAGELIQRYTSQITFWIDLQDSDVTHLLHFIEFFSLFPTVACRRLRFLFSHPRDEDEVAEFDKLFSHEPLWSHFLDTKPEIEVEIGFCLSMAHVFSVLTE